MGLIKRPLIATYAVLIIWFIVREHVPDREELKNDNREIGVVVGIVTGAWLLVAGAAGARAWAHRSDTNRIVNDAWALLHHPAAVPGASETLWNQFRVFRGRRLSAAIYVVLTSFYLLILLLLFFLYFANTAAGAVSVGATAFVLAVAIEFIRDVDEPSEGAFRINPLPPEWQKRLHNENRESRPR
ncbi:MAG: hypothetical protein AAB601_02170 [Patescibacteria group bacterium]